MSGGSVLGISPGGRFMGIAIVRDGALVHAQVHAFPGEWSDEKLQAMLRLVQSLIARHKVIAVTIKVPDVLPLTKSFHQIVGTLNVLCERNNLKPRYYSLGEIKKHHCVEGRPHKEHLMQKLVRMYPELMHEYKLEQRNKNAYYYRLFEAVGAAEMK